MRFALSAVAAAALAVPAAWAATSSGAGTPIAAPAPTRAVAAEQVATADALVRPAGVAAVPAAAVAKPQVAVYFEFAKNHKDPTKSTLSLYERRSNNPRPVLLGRWRAGSGLGLAAGGRNECASSRGWLPNGWYKGTLHVAHYPGSLVHGLVWQLQNKVCNNKKTVRTDLFIHSEMTPGGGQACHSPYIEGECWDGPGDYKSEGCIKLRPADIRAADRLFRQHSHTTFGTKDYPHLLLVTG